MPKFRVVFRFLRVHGPQPLKCERQINCLILRCYWNCLFQRATTHVVCIAGQMSSGPAFLPVIHLLYLLQNSFPGRSVLERKLGNNLKYLIRPRYRNPIHRCAQPKYKLVKPTHYPFVNDPQDNDSLRAVG